MHGKTRCLERAGHPHVAVLEGMEGAWRSVGTAAVRHLRVDDDRAAEGVELVSLAHELDHALEACLRHLQLDDFTVAKEARQGSRNGNHAQRARCGREQGAYREPCAWIRAR